MIKGEHIIGQFNAKRGTHGHGHRPTHAASELCPTAIWIQDSRFIVHAELHIMAPKHPLVLKILTSTVLETENLSVQSWNSIQVQTRQWMK